MEAYILEHYRKTSVAAEHTDKHHRDALKQNRRDHAYCQRRQHHQLECFPHPAVQPGPVVIAHDGQRPGGDAAGDVQNDLEQLDDHNKSGQGNVRAIDALLSIGFQQHIVGDRGGNNTKLCQEAACAQRQNGFQMLPGGNKVGDFYPKYPAPAQIGHADQKTDKLAQDRQVYCIFPWKIRGGACRSE